MVLVPEKSVFGSAWLHLLISSESCQLFGTDAPNSWLLDVLDHLKKVGINRLELGLGTRGILRWFIRANVDYNRLGCVKNIP